MADGERSAGQAAVPADAQGTHEEEQHDLWALEAWARQQDPALFGQLRSMGAAYRVMLDYCEFVQKTTSVDGVTWSATKRGMGRIGRGRTLAAAVLAALEEPSEADLSVV